MRGNKKPRFCWGWQRTGAFMQYPLGESNPCPLAENQISWATRRRGPVGVSLSREGMYGGWACASRCGRRWVDGVLRNRHVGKEGTWCREGCGAWDNQVRRIRTRLAPRRWRATPGAGVLLMQRMERIGDKIVATTDAVSGVSWRRRGRRGPGGWGVGWGGWGRFGGRGGELRRRRIRGPLGARGRPSRWRGSRG